MASRYTTTPRYSRKDSNYVSIGQRNFLAEADKLTADIKSLYDDYNTLYKQDSERGGGIDVYRTDSSAWYDNVSGLDSSLQAKADDVLKRVEYYKSYIDPEYYNNLTKSIGNIKSNGSAILANAQSMRDHYSNFKDEGEYMEWLEDYKYHNQDANEVKRELDSLKSQLDNLTGGNPNNFTPEAHALAKQYEEKTAYYNQLLKDQEVAKERADIINSEYTPESQLTFKGIYNKAMFQGIQNRESDGVFQFMTDDEKKIYRTYWERGDYQKAEDYFKELEPRLREGADKAFISRIGEVPVLRSVMSVPYAAAGGLENLVNVGKFATGMTDSLEKSKFTEASAAWRQSTTDWMGDGVGGKIGGFLYNTAMSATDSVALGTLLGPTGAAVSLGLNAASSATNDALERGMGDWRAFGNGIAAGVFEALFERISLGELDALKKAPVKSVTKEVIREAGINASEEMATEIANIIYDSLANGEFSNYAKMREEGMSPEGALLSMGGEVLLAGASGAVMGAGFGAVGGASAKKNYSSFYNSVSNDISKSGYTGNADLVASGLYKEKLKEAGIDGFRAITDAERSEVKKYRSRSQFNRNLDGLKVSMGANGRKEADLLDIGDRDPLAVATAFAARYKQGVNGSSIGGFDTAKYAILSETEQKIAYNAGKMDAAQSLSKKTEGFRAEKQAKIDAENARIEAERQEAETKKQKAIETKEQATYKKMTPQMQENAERYGLRKNGALAYAGDYTGDKSDASIGKYTENFIRAYNAGKKGTDISRVPLGTLTDGQRRRAYNAGKADIEQNAPKFSSADIKTTSGTTASSTVKQGSTKILADNSEAVAREIGKIESPTMRQYAEDFKLGENGVKTYASTYDKSQTEGVYTQGFVAAYNVGKSGKDISEVKASSLTEAQKKQAYNAGKMDAIKATVDDKKSRTKTFANGSKVVVADQTKLTAEQKNIVDNFAKAGIKVYLADIRTENGDSANGLYDHGTGIIYLSTNPRKALQFLAKHELTHFIEKRVGKQQYFDLMNTIFDSETFKKWYEGKGFKSLTEMEANKVEEYRKGGIELNKDDKLGAKKEILADFVGEMLFGGKNQISDSLFSELDDNHKKTFREWIGALIDRLKTLFKGNKTAEDEITKFEAKFKEMLRESVKSEAKGEGVSASYGGEKSETADRMRLDTAKQMISDGVSSEQVRKETGWFKGYDGKWRFEIDDSDVKIQIPMLLLREGEYTLDNVLSHSNLFEAYPELKNMKVSVVRGGIGVKGVVGSYNANKDTLVLNSAIYLKDEQLREVIIHELQHKIQNIEGFARGSSPEYWKAKGISEDEYNRFVEKSQLQFQKEYQKLSEDDRQKVFEYFQLGKKIDSLLGQINSSNLDSTIDSTEKILDELSNLESRHDALYDYLYYQPWFSSINTLYYQTEISDDLNTVFYKNTAGEIEARNAAERINLTAEQRKNTRPDIDREDVVFAENSSVSYFSKEKYDPETAGIRDQIKNSQDLLNSLPIVYTAIVPHKVGDKESAGTWAISELKKYGFQADRKGFGKIYFNEKSIRDAMNYLDTDAEKVSIVGIYKVLKQGIQIGEHTDHKQRGKHTITFAAPVELNGKRGNMAVVVNLRINQYKVHRIVMPDGSIFKFDEIKNNAEQESQRGVPKRSLANATSSASNGSISRKNTFVNTSDEKNSDTSLSYTSETDSKYLDAVNRGDTETAQKMVDEAAKKAGYDYHLYHGTNADFTKFDLLKHGGKNGKGEGYGIYLAANREISAPYGKNVIDSYVKFNRLAEGRKKTLSYAEVKKLVKQSCEVEAKRAVADGEADSISEAIRDTWVSNYVYTYDYSSMAKVYADVADMLWEGNDNDGELINEIMASSGAHYNYAGALDFYENILTPATGIDGFHYIWGNEDGSGVQNDVYLAFKSEQVKSADPITYDDNGDIIPLSQRFNEGEGDIRFSYTPDDEQELTRMAQNGEITAEEYGRRMLEMKERKSADDPYTIAHMKPEDMLTTPKLDRTERIGKGDGERDFFESIQRSNIFDETFKEEMKSSDFLKRYETITNKDTLKKAAKMLDEGGREFVEKWKKKEAIQMSPLDVAVGFILQYRYQEVGDYNSALEVTEKLGKLSTVTGQTLQIFSVIGRLDANGMQAWAQKSLDKAYEEAVKNKTQNWIDKNKERFQLTPEDIDYIRTRTIQAAYLPDGRDKDIRLAEISARLGDKLPPSFGKSVKAWQRISLLGNFITQGRNVLGNVIAGLAYIPSDFTASLADLAISKKTGYRTTGISNPKTSLSDMGKGFKKGFFESRDDYKRHINTKISDKFEIGSGKSFNEQGKFKKIAAVMNRMDRLVSHALDLGDRPFYEMWFTKTLNEQMRLNNVTEPTLEMVELAEQVALERTWQSDNLATQLATRTKKLLNGDFTQTWGKHKGENRYKTRAVLREYGLGDIYIKYTKTIANICKAIYDFSPAAAISITAKATEFNKSLKNGTFKPQHQKELADAIGKAMTGTFLYIAFGLLAAKGLITGKSDDDKDIAAFEKYVQGKPEYSIKLGDKWWSYDWAQPIGAIPAIVSNAMESMKDGDDFLGVFVKSLEAGGEVLFNQSFAVSLQKLFTSDGLDKLFDSFLGETTAFVPTLFGQTANAFDSNRRVTYEKGKVLKNTANRIAVKIPGLRNTLEPELDVLGRETPNSKKHWFNAFFNPMNTFTDTSTAVTDHVYELYQSTGKASAIPAKAPYDVTIKGVKHTFSIDERNEYQRIMGETSAQIIGELINNDSYIALTDEQKLEVIKSVYTYAQGLAKSELGLAESYDVISEIKVDLTQDQYNAMSGEEIKAIADDYLLSSYYSLGGLDTTKKATWFVNKSLPTAVNAAIKAGDMAKAKKLINSIEANIKSFGLPAKETKEMIKNSQASIKSEITSYWKGKFIEAHKRGDNGEKIRIKQILVDTGLYGNSADVRDLTNGWKKEK